MREYRWSGSSNYLYRSYRGSMIQKVQNDGLLIDIFYFVPCEHCYVTDDAISKKKNLISKIYKTSIFNEEMCNLSQKNLS